MKKNAVIYVLILSLTVLGCAKPASPVTDAVDRIFEAVESADMEYLEKTAPDFAALNPEQLASVSEYLLPFRSGRTVEIQTLGDTSWIVRLSIDDGRTLVVPMIKDSEDLFRMNGGMELETSMEMIVK